MTLGLPLPRFIVLQSSRNPNSGNRYLRYAAEEGELDDAIACNGDTATNPNAKFEVEQATHDVLAVDKPMVHIRSCYSNKYLRLSSDNERSPRRCLVAVAEKPEEDRSRCSCTLFEPDFSTDDPNTIRLLHVQSGLYLRWSDDICILSASPIQNNHNDEEMFMFKVICWESLVILPKYVAFRGDNGLYIGARRIDNVDSPCLQFAISDLTDDKSVKNQLVPTPDGRTVRIKNVRSGSFWKRDDHNWICPIGDEESSSSEDAMLFQVIKITDNVIALLNLANNHFCKRYTVKAATSCLSAIDSTVTEFARLEIVELVSSRSIYNIEFRLDHARMVHSDDENRRIMASCIAMNNTGEPRTKNLKLTFDDSRTMTWKNSSSLRLPKKVRIQSEVAHIGTGSEIVVTSGEFGDSTYEWGETTARTWREMRVHKVAVPPMSKVTVRLWGTVGTCEVPFSYVQRDVFGDGEVETCVRDDGFYSGTNCYDFVYETLEESLA